MLSRAAGVQRICLTCRLGLAQRSATRAAGLSIQGRGPAQRRYKVDSTIQNKERVEAMITGRPSDDPEEEPSRRHRRQRRDHPQPEDDIADSELLETTPEEIPDATRLEAPRFQWETRSETAQKWAKRAEEAAQGRSAAQHHAPAEAQVDGREELDDDAAAAINLLNELEAEEEEALWDNEASDSAAVLPDPYQHALLRNRTLRVDALGRPIDALILKNPNRIRRPKQSVQIVNEKESPAMLDWDVLVQKDDAADSDALKEALDNIEELRPKESNVVKNKDFKHLASTLVDGFTRDQLAHYLGHHRQRGNSAKLHTSWLVKQGDWESPEPDARGSLKPKQQQALLILEEVWALRIKEHDDDLGRTSIWLRPAVFQIIARPSNPILESIKNDLLDESADEQINAVVDESRLDIYSRQTIAPVVLARLDKALRTITSRNISVRHVSRENLTQAVLEDLGRITNTHIKHNKLSSEVKISWLENETRSPPATDETKETASRAVEDPADMVSRLLLGGPAQTLQSDAQVVVPSSTAKSTKGVFVAHHREMRSMSWRDKLNSWSRYVYPITKVSKGKAKSLHLVDRVSLPMPPLAVAEDGTQNHVTASFGHILHTRQEVDAAKLASARRIISPLIPHPAAFTSLTGDEDQTVIQHTAIVINFSPTLSRTEGATGKAPEVRLRLPVDSDTDLAEFAVPPESVLHGVVPWHVNDVLLPSESVDVRLAQHQVLPLDINQPSLRAFLAGSEFNLLAGRLRTPSQVTLSIPRRWLSAAGDVPTDGSTDIPYTFAGLEIHQTVDLEWKAHMLRYSSIEAGQHGGQRQELSLQAGAPGSDGKTVLDEPQRAEFLQLVEEIALGKHFSWGQGHELMKERSEPDFDIEMAEEGLLEEALPGEDAVLGESLGDRQELTDDDDIPFEPRLSEEEDTVTLEHDDQALGVEDNAIPFELRPSEEDTITPGKEDVPTELAIDSYLFPEGLDNHAEISREANDGDKAAAQMSEQEGRVTGRGDEDNKGEVARGKANGPDEDTSTTDDSHKEA